MSGGGKGGDGGGSAPAAPDPEETARAQSRANLNASMANGFLLNPSINSPFGNVSYDTNGQMIDGQWVQRPTQTIRLSPQEQSNYQYRSNMQNALKNSALDISDPRFALNMPDAITSIDYSKVMPVADSSEYTNFRDKATKAYYDNAYALMKPDLDQQENNVLNRLAQTGNPLGSESYNKELNRYSTNRNQNLTNLANQALLMGPEAMNSLLNSEGNLRTQQIAMAQLPYNTNEKIRQDAMNDYMTTRGGYINELSAALNGNALQLPQGAGYAASPMQAPNISGMINNNYQTAMQNYQQQQQNANNSSNGFTSGLFSMGAAAMPLFF